MELSKDLFQLLRDRQAKVSGILQQAQAFIAAAMDREVQQSAREGEAPHHKTEEASLCLKYFYKAKT